LITEIGPENLNRIRNPEMAAYARIYLKIYDDFMRQLEGLELGIDLSDTHQQAEEISGNLKNKGAIPRNQSKSIYVNRISPACLACQTGMGSATFFISLKCHRNCYYCFNPYQENYEFFITNKRDLIQELEEIRLSGQKVKHLALTGGEPLLFKQDALAFFSFSHEHFPKAYTRLYTSGDHADFQILEQLRDAGLDEIRFSIRMHDLEKGQRHVFDRIALAKVYIPRVMVEMPVIPGTFKTMQDILIELDRLDIYGINLLEFCFPFNNAEIFRQHGFRLKNHPYRVLYNYWYAGGLPIAGSQQVCLDLVNFALDQGLRLGVHYCSLENKHTGQIYQQNKSQPLPKHAAFSHKDFFIKTAKVFGKDIAPALQVFKKSKYQDYILNDTYHFLEFHPKRVKTLAKLNPEIGISYSVWERRDGEAVLRELKVDYATAKDFNFYQDI
jgi:pyruvate formate-lyase activating enzyme-like uncharacterized protein